MSFRFLETERHLLDVRDWDRSDWPRLWRYNLHYFDDLAADGAAERSEWHRALVARWVADNPPGRGTGWEPYPTSLRAVNWIKAELSGRNLGSSAIDSLAVQARWLRRRLERHLLGNHLLANAKALVFCGAFFKGGEAARWRSEGLALWRRELAEQVLPDGGHFERSPMYHAIVLEDVLDLIQLARIFPDAIAETDVEAWRAAAANMLRWLEPMTHPDGGIGFFNDAAFGIAPDLGALRSHAGLLGLSFLESPQSVLKTLSASGYVRIETGPAALIADVGEVGPDYLPGHAHADSLSFELSLYGERLLVNGGTSTYETGEERVRQRGTLAHNTVCIDGQDSSEVWASFRVARRARPFALKIANSEGISRVSCAHDGYIRLPGRVIHKRHWALSDRSLSIEDTLSGSFEEAVASFLLHPSVEIIGIRDNQALLRHHGRDVIFRIRGGALASLPSRWHPKFGSAVDTCVLRSTIMGDRLLTEITWS